MVDLAQLKQELETKLIELKSRVQAVDERLRSPGLADSEEDALAHEDDEVLNQIGDATAHELHEVQHALSRLESGQYGMCRSCGQRISLDRLEALPFATTCIGCAESNRVDLD